MNKTLKEKSQVIDFSSLHPMIRAKMSWDFFSIINIFEMNFQEWKIPFHSSEFSSESWAKKIVVAVDAMAIIW